MLLANKHIEQSIGRRKRCEYLQPLLLRVFRHWNTHDVQGRQGRTRSMATARILVINDTQEILELFQDLLEGEGYEVIISSFAPKTVYEIGSLQPDLVILDLVFGSERIGWQLLQQMRMYRPTARIPIIVCTAAREDVREMEPQLVSHGAFLVLKPFDIDEIILIVRQALELPRSSAPLLLPDDDPNQLTRHDTPQKRQTGKRTRKRHDNKETDAK